MVENYEFAPIGVIRSPHKEIEGTPIQPSGARGVGGTVELRPEFVPGLKDLDGFSHIMLLYVFHLSEGFSLEVKPFLDDTPRGLFATRAPGRPNAIGVSVVRLRKIEGSVLFIEDVDILDGTPVLDIKPFVPEFDSPEVTATGWLTGKAGLAEKKRADERFK
jgi:tRNA-Thr(GGU) m(6)t(6)A37 methyltransferase TsaA